MEQPLSAVVVGQTSAKEEDTNPTDQRGYVSEVAVSIPTNI